MTTIGNDTFTRANQSGWGTASDGQTWTHLVGVLTDAIASNEGTVTNDPGHDNWFALGTKTQADTEGLVRFKFTNSANDVPGLMFRHNGATTAATTNAYRVVYNGTTLGLRRVNSGVATTLGTNFAFSASNNTFYWMRAKIIGSTLYARIWADGSGEPTTWGVTATDGSPLSAAGRFGLYAIINTSTTDTLTFDSFTATDTLNPKDIATRFRLAKLMDIATRFRLSGGTQSIRDIASRFRLMQQSVKDVASRFRLKSADQLKDVATRFRLMSANQLKDIASRFRLAQQSLRDVATRFRLMQQSTRDIASRFRLMSANQLKDVRTRFRLMSANQLKDIAVRFRLTTTGALQTKDIACRFVLMAPPDVVWVTRDGRATWVTRDGQATWKTRDDKVTWDTRDGSTTWDTRDGKVTWKARP